MMTALRRIFGKRLNLTLIVLLVQIFLFVNANWIYGDFAPRVKDIFIVYFFLFLFVFAMEGSAKLPDIKIRTGLTSFMLGFFLTAIVMFVVLPFIGGTAMLSSIDALKIAIGFGVFHSFVKAYLEEMTFRYGLRKGFGIPAVGTSILFGAFHMGMLVFAFGFTFNALIAGIFLGVLGYVWSMMSDRWGLMSAVGSHYAYNLAVMGILTVMFSSPLGMAVLISPLPP